MTRGVVVPLTAAQRRTRMLYLAQEARIADLDTYVAGRDGSALAWRTVPGYEDGRSICCDGYYRLNGEHDGLPPYNGGKDPTAIDPFDRWVKPGGKTVNRTADCIGGMSWCGGFDRFQEVRFSHLYNGWINTDSMVMDARRQRRCFRLLDRPEPGCFVVLTSGSGGHKVGHIGGVTDVPVEWNPAEIECWKLLKVVDMAARVGPGNRRGNPLTWFHAHGVFVVPTMT